VIAYIDGNNNIESDALEQVKEMEQGIPDTGLDIIVLLGGQ